MIKDRRDYRAPKVLGFFVCNPDAVITFIFIFVVMICTVVLMQLLAYSDLYSQSEVCMPILYFSGGSTNGCKRAVARSANIYGQVHDVYSQVNKLKEYKKELEQGAGGARLYESFVGNRRSEIQDLTTRFSQIKDTLNESYHRFVRELIIYGMKLYRDIFLPISRR